MKIREDSSLMPHLDDYLYGQFSGRKKKKKIIISLTYLTSEAPFIGNYTFSPIVGSGHVEIRFLQKAIEI